MYLNVKQKQFYEDNGYILLKNVLSDGELSQIIGEYERLFKKENGIHEESSLDENARNSLLKVKGIHHLEDQHAVFTKLITNDNILDALQDIMETENIMLHHTKAFYEPPGEGAAYPMHQDYHQCPYEKDSMVTIFLHLDAANAENGGLIVYPGSHKLGLCDVVGEKQSNACVDPAEFPLEKGTPIIAERGDMIIFPCFLIHGSLLNTTNQPRRVLLAQFAAADDKPKEDEQHEIPSGIMLRGSKF